MDLRTCKICVTNLTLDNFYKKFDKRNNKYYYSTYCKSCEKEKSRLKQKDYYKENPKKILERNKKSNLKNIDKYREYHREYMGDYYNSNLNYNSYSKIKAKEYRLNNLEKRKEYEKQYREKNKVLLAAKRRERYNQDPIKENLVSKNYRENNKEKVKQIYKNYIKNNKSKVLANRSRYAKERRLKDPMFKLICNVRKRVSEYASKEKSKDNKTTMDLVGCTTLELKEHLEKQFTKGMTWENYGKWHIDHIKPLSIAKNKKELYLLFNYTNLQPLWALDNLIKNNSY